MALLLLSVSEALCRDKVSVTHKVAQARTTSTNVAKHVDVVVYSDKTAHSDEKPSMGVRLLCYIPNRILDFFDMFRLRAKVGPGLSCSAQITKSLSVYAGSQHVAWVGLPGPRNHRRLVAPFGLEQERGLRLLGVDATDDMQHEIIYSPSEADIGIHLLFVGGEIGFDIIELADFFSGFLMIDIRGDDIERHHELLPVVSHNLGWDMFDEMKPDRFASFSSRLDYIGDNLPKVTDTKMRELDYTLSGEDQYIYTDEQLSSKLRIGLYMEIEKDKGVRLKPDADFDMDVKLPGLERRWNLYITQEKVNELPGTLPSDRENGLNIGLSSLRNKYGIRTSVGVKARLPPKAYTAVKWSKKYKPGDWYLTPYIKGYWESDEGWGQVTSLRINRWLNTQHSKLFRSTTAGRFTRDGNGWNWEQSFGYGSIKKMITEEHGENLRGKDVAYGMGIGSTIFGHINAGSAVIDSYRVRFIYRREIYKRWIYLDISPQCEWHREDDWRAVYMLRVGVDMLFYGIDEL